MRRGAAEDAQPHGGPAKRRHALPVIAGLVIVGLVVVGVLIYFSPWAEHGTRRDADQGTRAVVTEPKPNFSLRNRC